MLHGAATLGKKLSDGIWRKWGWSDPMYVTWRVLAVKIWISGTKKCRTVGNCLLTAGLRTQIFLRVRLLTSQHSYIWLVVSQEDHPRHIECHSGVFNDESRFSLYLSHSHLHAYGIGIFKSVFMHKRSGLGITV